MARHAAVTVHKACSLRAVAWTACRVCGSSYSADSRHDPAVTVAVSLGVLSHVTLP
jgi:hypothetical protein